MSTIDSQTSSTLRQRWMRALSHADELTTYADLLTQESYQTIRPPEIGMVMVRGRMGGSGAPFNLGETTITRCAVRGAEGYVGFGYVVGRDKRRAELAAMADAQLQGNRQDYWMQTLILPLEQARQTKLATHQAEHAATRVEFFTLVRGEDA